MRLDNPLLVQWEYASEERLATRNAIFRALLVDEGPEERAFQAIAEVRPARVLEVGCGTGEFARRIMTELGATVTAIDTSARMVTLATELGLDARVADVQELPFEDGSFDCVSAGWVLYHAPALDSAIAECARVLTPGGRLVASTVGDNLLEVWELIGAEKDLQLSFSAANGAEKLRPYFARVEEREVVARVVFPDPESMRGFVASAINRAHLAPNVPDFEGEFRATSRHMVFVAEKAES
jgi:SAM-dependent methyltransferase